MTIRVLVVDDSAFARKVVREILEDAADVEVVGIARDGAEALEQIAALQPEVVTLDLLMPVLDGLAVLRAANATGAQAPAFVVVSSSESSGAMAMAALDAGAVDIVHKPTSLATAGLYEIRADLLHKVRTAAAAHAKRKQTRAPSLQTLRTSGALQRFRPELVVLGTSTGGPQAITRVLEGLTEPLPVGMVVVVHIPAGYTAAMAERLDRQSVMRVQEAQDGQWVEPGLALLAPGGQHLTLAEHDGRWQCTLSDHPAGLHKPSVDQLFTSAASATTLGVVMTGMGEDGLVGSRAIHEAGGQIITEAESSCVVYGMPRVVFEAGLSGASVPLEKIAPLLMHVTSR